jgi:hypothetical protein
MTSTRCAGSSVAIPRPAPATLRTLGATGAAASALGALSAVAILATDPMVRAVRYSYPFDATWFVVAQLFFTAQHVAMLPLFAGLLVAERARRSRTVRLGTWIAITGQVALTAAEVFAIRARDALSTGPTADAVNAVYGPPMLLIGGGLLVAGVGVLRTRLLPGAGRWLPVALGGYVFVVLIPAVFGPMAAGRIAIGFWMLMFVALGLALRRARP